MSRNDVKFADLQVGDTVDFEPRSKALRDTPASGTVTALTHNTVTVSVIAAGTSERIVASIRRASLVLERRMKVGGRYHWVFQ